MRLPKFFVLAAMALAPVLLLAQADTQALQRMVATERAFAAATAEVGVRDGFLAFFADDAVQIQRAASVTLGRATEGLARQALPKLPIINQLIWEPFTGQVSSDGSLGWLTGGYVLLNQAQKETVAQGAYFSVWKRQPNGTWRVWLDEGIRLPQIWRDAAPFRPAPEPDAGTQGASNETIAAVEMAFQADSRPSVEFFRNRLASEARFHRDGEMPIVGRDAILSWMSKRPAGGTCPVLRTESAASNDLAIVVGGCEAAIPPAKAMSFVRVWKRDITGRWRIVFLTENSN